MTMSNIERFQYPISYFHTAAKSWLRHDVDTELLLKVCEIDSTKLESPGATLSQDELQRIYKICAKFNRTGTPESILVAEQFSFTNVGLLGLAIIASDTFHSVLNLLTRYCSVFAPGLSIEYHQSDDNLFLDYSMDKSFGEVIPFFNEVVVCVMKRFSEQFREPLAPSMVYFAHTPAFPIELYRQYLECPVETNYHVNRLCFNASDLSTPLNHPDRSTLALIEAQLRSAAQQEAIRHSWSQKIEDIWHTKVEQQQFLSQKEMADYLHISPRTLVRRLADEGVSYRSLTQQWRLEKAKLLLRESEWPITEVAIRVGFDDESAFFRFFKEAVGMTPRAFRKA